MPHTIAENASRTDGDDLNPPEMAAADWIVTVALPLVDAIRSEIRHAGPGSGTGAQCAGDPTKRGGDRVGSDAGTTAIGAAKQKLEVKGLRSMGSAQVVHTEIVKQSGSPSVIDYVMRPATAGWKATDVLLDGSISQVAVLRSDFRSLLARGLLALAAHLEQKATELHNITRQRSLLVG
jgi:hypothetical protein